MFHRSNRLIVLWAVLLLPVAAGDSYSSLQVETLASGEIVFLDEEGYVVGWVSTPSTEVSAVVGPTPPQLPGWPVDVGEVFATPTVGDVDNDGSLEVVVGAVRDVYVIRVDGTIQPGWPVDTEGRSGQTASLVDVDNNGTLEIFVSAHQELFGLSSEGEMLPGWPQPGTFVFRTVAVDDLDGDGAWELVASDLGNGYLWSTSGVLQPGWPIQFATRFAQPTLGQALGDIDGDGLKEVVFPVDGVPGLYAFRINGQLQPGFPVNLQRGVRAGAVIADIGADGSQEIVLREPGDGVWVLDGQGEPLVGWPAGFGRGETPIAIGDIDGDGRLEIVWGSAGGDARVHAINDDGTILEGWPITVPSFSFNPQPTLGDVDGDGMPDIVLGGFTASFSTVGRIYAWHMDGTLVDGFPFVVPNGNTILFSAVTITDLDQDGDVDLLVGTTTGFGASGSGRVYAFDLQAPYNPTTLEWPTKAHDIRHTNRYEPPPRLAAHAGFDQHLECTSPAGAMVSLDGSHSADKDSSAGTNDDIVAFEWFQGLGTAGNIVGSGQILTIPLGFGTHDFTLRVTDSTGNQETDTVRITVVDSTPPAFSARFSHEFLWPPNHRMIHVETQASASDLCGPASFVLESVRSSEPDDSVGLGDGKTTGDIQGEETGMNDTSFELRAERDGRGDGRTYTVVYRAEDVSGNSVTTTFEVLVPHDLGGSTEPLMLSLSEIASGTVVQWGEVPGALSYDLVRGKLKALKDLNGAYHLGLLKCIVGGTTQTSTAGQENSAQPALGEGFFYLAAYDDGSPRGYGTQSAAKERFVPPGQDGCH